PNRTGSREPTAAVRTSPAQELQGLRRSTSSRSPHFRVAARVFEGGQYSPEARLPRNGSAARAARACEPLEDRLGLLDRQAGVGDALAVDGGLPGHIVLTPFDEVALDHRAEDLPRSRGDLIGDRRGDVRLAQMILVAVAVRAVHHDALAQPFRREAGADLRALLGVAARLR